MKRMQKITAIFAAMIFLLTPTSCKGDATDTSTSFPDGSESSAASQESDVSSDDSSEVFSSEDISSDTSSVSSKPQEKREKVAYLTFDDGPTEMTPKILDVLKEYGVKATFFVVHKDSETLAAYVKRAFDEGHEIAAHSYTHEYRQVYQSADTFMEDFEKTAAWIKSITGQKTTQYRFPGGSSNSYVTKADLNEILYRMGERGCVHHDWNVSSGDAAATMRTKEQILESVLGTAVNYNEPVILMHDVTRNVSTLEALPEMIEQLQEQGYTFDTVGNIHQPSQHRTYKN